MHLDSPQKIIVDLKTHKLCVHQWLGPEPTLLFLHATGFHGRIWDQIIKAFPKHHVVAVDLRNHGYSGPAPSPLSWKELAEDLYQVVEYLNLTQIFGIGHSCGGHLLLLAAARHPERYKQLLLLDPVVFEPQMLPVLKKRSNQEHPVSKRRNHWESAEHMFEHFRKRSPYSAWHSSVLKDYCAHGLKRKADTGGYQLACTPEAEANIYRQCYGQDVYKALPYVKTPVTIVRAKQRVAEDPIYDFSPSPTWPELARNLPSASDIHLKKASHFFPMEKPELIIQFIQQLKHGKVTFPQEPVSVDAPQI